MEKRARFVTTLEPELITEIKVLAAKNRKRTNDLLEEAIRDLIEKYRKISPIKYS